jgi:P27 family predicted phage terminase small subunit
MGRRGPAPSPTRLKVLRGETRPSRVNYREPKPTPGLPERPPDLAPGAEAAWERVVAELAPTGVLTGADRDVLRTYVEAVARYEQAAAAYAASGPLIRGARAGELIKNPLHQIVRDNAQLVLVLARELGLTPSARSGLRSPQPSTGGSRLDAFLAESHRVG